MDKELLKKLQEAGTETETMPTTKPDIAPTPSAPPAPQRPRSPIRPEPGPAPKPKAVGNPDLELFLSKRGLSLGESKVNEFAFDAGDKGDLVHQDKKDWIENPDEQLKKILPELSDSEQTYAEMIASQTYKDMVSQIEKYCGVTVTNRSTPRLVGLLMSSLQTVVQIESTHKKQLEELALTAVFEVPEFKMVEDAYQGGEVKFDMKIGPAELEKLIDPPSDEVPVEGELSEDEQLNLDLANDFDKIMDTAVKRRFSNLMITGGATQNLFIFHMVDAQLTRIDPRLPKLYGILGSLAMLGYWVTPEGVEQAAAKNTAGGSEELEFNKEADTIKARGIAFPFLAYELTKGIYEWLSYSKDQASAFNTVDGLEKETNDMLAGPGIYKAITSYIDPSRTEILPLVKRKLVNLTAEEIKSVLAKDEAGQKIMADIIAQAEKDWDEYSKTMGAYKNYNG